MFFDIYSNLSSWRRLRFLCDIELCNFPERQQPIISYFYKTFYQFKKN